MPITEEQLVPPAPSLQARFWRRVPLAATVILCAYLATYTVAYASRTTVPAWYGTSLDERFVWMESLDHDRIAVLVLAPLYHLHRLLPGTARHADDGVPPLGC